ncbi:MAG: SRPBCC domain-containing protein [Caldimonas sp.]
MTETAPFTLTMTRLIRAPRERVYDAFVTDEALRAWMCPRGMGVAELAFEPRPGGAWRMLIRSRDGSHFKLGGVYRALQRPDRIAYTWQWEEGPMAGLATLVEVDFAERDGATVLTMRHSGFPSAAARDAHGRGWNGPLNKLSDLLDPRGSASSLTLYGLAPSSYTRTARLALAEKGIACTFHECGPHGPDILAVNPFGRLPALSDGEFSVYETSAIVRYLDEAFEGTPLLPASIADRARCEQWTSAFGAYFYEPIVAGYIRRIFFPGGEGGQPDRTAIGAALAKIPALLAILEAGYAKSAWLAGDALSMADLFFMPVLAYLERMPDGPRLLEAAPSLRRALAAMRGRPSFSATEPGGRFG